MGNIEHWTLVGVRRKIGSRERVYVEVGAAGPSLAEGDEVEVVRADAYRGAVSSKITDAELDAAWSAWSERWVTSSGRDAMREALMTFVRLRAGGQ